LITVASKEFADGGALGKVVDMLNDIRATLVEELNKIMGEEEKNQEDFETELKSK